jgi:hypothetical protein
VRAAQSILSPVRRFATGLRADRAAVQAAVTLPWSQGPLEGQITRLKRLKRQMVGRARLDLLARRFLLAACPAPGHPLLRTRAYTRAASSPFITKTGQEP